MAKDTKQAPLPDDDDKVSLTRGELRTLLRDAAEAAAHTAMSTQRATLGVTTPTTTWEERTHAQLGKPVPDRTPHAERSVKCLNELNGARFTAIVVPSRRFPEGIVVKLHDYEYPKDLVERSGRTKSDTGFPSTEHVWKPGHETADPRGKHGLVPEFLEWRAQNYWAADLKQFVGKSAKLLPRLPGVEGEPQDIVPEEWSRLVDGASVKAWPTR